MNRLVFCKTPGSPITPPVPIDAIKGKGTYPDTSIVSSWPDAEILNSGTFRLTVPTTSRATFSVSFGIGIFADKVAECLYPTVTNSVGIGVLELSVHRTGVDMVVDTVGSGIFPDRFKSVVLLSADMVKIGVRPTGSPLIPALAEIRVSGRFPVTVIKVGVDMVAEQLTVGVLPEALDPGLMLVS